MKLNQPVPELPVSDAEQAQHDLDGNVFYFHG